MHIVPFSLEHGGVRFTVRPLTLRERFTFKARLLSDFGGAIHDIVRHSVIDAAEPPGLIDTARATREGLSEQEMTRLCEHFGLDFLCDLGARIAEAARLDGDARKNFASPAISASALDG